MCCVDLAGRIRRGVRAALFYAGWTGTYGGWTGFCQRLGSPIPWCYDRTIRYLRKCRASPFAINATAFARCCQCGPSQLWRAEITEAAITRRPEPSRRSGCSRSGRRTRSTGCGSTSTAAAISAQSPVPSGCIWSTRLRAGMAAPCGLTASSAGAPGGRSLCQARGPAHWRRMHLNRLLSPKHALSSILPLWLGVFSRASGVPIDGYECFDFGEDELATAVAMVRDARWGGQYHS
jgi:hypothetical protein